MSTTRPGWEEYALRLAEAAATRSEDPWFKVGAVVLGPDHEVEGTGYNGAPAGINLDWHDRQARRPLVVHAEVNALRWTLPGLAEMLASTHMPCSRCVVEAAAYGIKKIVFRNLLDPLTYSEDEIRLTATAVGIELVQIT